MFFDFYSNELEKAKEYTLKGYDLTRDQYYTVIKKCEETMSWDEEGRIARGILYTLKRNGWRQLKYIRDRDTRKEEYYANQGYSLY